MDVVRKENYKLDARYTQFITTEQAWHYRITSYSINDNVLGIYVDESNWNSSLSDELEIILSHPFEVDLIPSKDMDKYLAANYRKSDKGRTQVQVHIKQAEQFVSALIAEAFSLGSSDIHIEVMEEHARVRIRLDGNLVEKYRFEKSEYPALVNKLKIKSHLDISEKRLPQDGRIQFNENGRKFDIRVSILPTLHGEKIVLRILSSDAGGLSISQLGLNEIQENLLLESIKRPSGILLVSGPTGSGKTTTLYASLKELNEEKRNIMTVEDPVEYTLDGVNQVQLKDNIGLSFSKALRSFLRQDPDVIMVGEIRDKETAIIAIRAALTGHLVLSTIHTNSAWGTISRLIDMGIPPYLLATTINTSIAQRLVRLLCEKCKKEVSSNTDEFPRNYSQPYFVKSAFEAVGCPDCHFTGYNGRKAVYEIINIDRDLSSLIKENKDEIHDELKQRNIASLDEAAFDVYAKGQTSLEEIYPILMQST